MSSQQRGTGTTSSQSTNGLTPHSHVSKVLKWQYDLIDGDMKQKVSLYGCTKCDETSLVPFREPDQVTEHDDHKSFVDGCFGCKIKTLELATGDAAGHIIESGTTQKKWDKELDKYRDARRQGIKPEGTSTAAIEKAIQASEVLNKPYDGETMPKAAYINEKSVEVFKEVGAV